MNSPLVPSETSRPWGVGFQSWAIDPPRWSPRCITNLATVMLSFGDPPAVRPARPPGRHPRSSSRSPTWKETRQALDGGRGRDRRAGHAAGGHGARRGYFTLAFTQAVIDLVAPVPVLAAGGIADGRGLAAALALGAAGALIGTRFQATAESLVGAEAKKAIVDGHGEDTERSTACSTSPAVPGGPSPPGAHCGHPVRDQWRGEGISTWRGSPLPRRAYQKGRGPRGTLPPEPVWASPAVDLIHDLPSAADLVGFLAAQAEEALTRILSRSPRVQGSLLLVRVAAGQPGVRPADSEVADLVGEGVHGGQDGGPGSAPRRATSDQVKQGVGCTTGRDTRSAGSDVVCPRGELTTGPAADAEPARRSPGRRSRRHRCVPRRRRFRGRTAMRRDSTTTKMSVSASSSTTVFFASTPVSDRNPC